MPRVLHLSFPALELAYARHAPLSQSHVSTTSVGPVHVSLCKSCPVMGSVGAAIPGQWNDNLHPIHAYRLSCLLARFLIPGSVPAAFTRKWRHLLDHSWLNGLCHTNEHVVGLCRNDNYKYWGQTEDPWYGSKIPTAHLIACARVSRGIELRPRYIDLLELPLLVSGQTQFSAGWWRGLWERDRYIGSCVCNYVTNWGRTRRLWG